MKTLLLATLNTHKIAELRVILQDIRVQILTLEDFPELPELPETGHTFEANALQKARLAFTLTGHWVAADDSGIEVLALGNAPGVHSKRFSPEQTAAANNALLLERLAPHADRRARFRCVMALVGPGVARTADGRCEGHIATSPRGTGGFGYDPLFLPGAFPGRTMAELTMQEKNSISHRGHAFRRLPALLPLIPGSLP